MHMFYRRATCLKDAEGMESSVDPDQTAPDLGLHRPDLPVRIFRTIMGI